MGLEYGRKERDDGPARQDGGPIGAYAGSQAGIRVHPDQLGPGGYPIRDPDSTTYTGAIETAAEFGKRIYLEAWKRGWSHAEKKVVMGDGAERIWNLSEQHFPGAVQIVDLYHARQHLWELT